MRGLSLYVAEEAAEGGAAAEAEGWMHVCGRREGVRR